MKIFIGCPLNLPMSALIKKASFGRSMDIPWIWISCGYLMDDPQDVRWIENATWDNFTNGVVLDNLQISIFAQ